MIERLIMLPVQFFMGIMAIAIFAAVLFLAAIMLLLVFIIAAAIGGFTGPVPAILFGVVLVYFAYSIGKGVVRG